MAALVLASSAIGGGAWAQCTTTNNSQQIVAFAPFARASIVNSIVTTLSTVQLGSLAQSTAFVGSPANPQPNQQGAGSWNRIVAGSVETRSNSSSAITSQPVATQPPGPLGPPVTGQVDCATKAEQDFVTTQFGFDLARHNFGGGTNFHLGLTGGYTDVTTKDRTPSTPGFADGNFSSETQIPFVGVYASIYAGNFAFDAQVRWDWLRSEINDTSIGAFNQHHDARSLAFLWNAAYRFALPNNWFIEPSIGGVWARSEVDQLAVAGTFAGGDINGTSPGFLQVDDVKSLTGRASIRLGTVITQGNVALQPFVVGSVFHEFAGNVRSTFRGDDTQAGFVGGATTLFASNGTVSTSRVGTYGHVGVGLAGTIIDTGWLGYARFDYRGGDNIDGYSFNAGVRYQFAPPKAADQGSVKDGPKEAYVAPAVNWTGLYVGYFSGVLWSENHVTFTRTGRDTSPDVAGYLIGGTVGANYQHGHIVLGIEGDYGFSNAEGGQACPTGVFFTCTAKIDNLGIVAGRLGVTHGRALLYVKAGLAVADVRNGFERNGGPAVAAVQGLVANDSRTRSMSGWAYGVGAEFAFSDRWSAKAEYMHFDLGRETFATSDPISAEVEGDIVRVGLNYRFGLHRHETYGETLK